MAPTCKKLALLAMFVMALVISRSQAASTRDEETIRDLDKAWSQAADNKDAAKCASYYSDTASAMPFNGPIATGRVKIQELWTALMAKPGFSLHFAPTRIEVAKAKDIAYDAGTFELKLNGRTGCADDHSREICGGMEKTKDRGMES